MANLKRPELKLCGNMLENFKNFEMRLDYYCVQAGYRDLTKNAETEQAAYYKSPKLEIATLRSAMPDEALQLIRYTIAPQISEEDKEKPWVWMSKLRIHYTGISGSSLMTNRFKLIQHSIIHYTGISGSSLMTNRFKLIQHSIST